MSFEIERKFLINDDSWKDRVKSRQLIKQAYVSFPTPTHPEVRVEHILDLPNKKLFNINQFNLDGLDEHFYLTIKSQGDFKRREIQTMVDKSVADEMFDFASESSLVIEKIRHYVKIDEHLFEIDVYQNHLSGLSIVEIELDSESSTFPQESFLGKEVTFNKSYKNSSLAIATPVELGKVLKMGQNNNKPRKGLVF